MATESAEGVTGAVSGSSGEVTRVQSAEGVCQAVSGASGAGTRSLLGSTYPVPTRRRLDIVNDSFVAYPRLVNSTSGVVERYFSGPDSENLGSDVYKGVPFVVSGGVAIYIRLYSPVYLYGYLIDLVSGTAPEIVYTRDDAPSVVSGNWVSLGTATLTPISFHRTPVMFTAPVADVTAVMFKFTTSSEVGNLHLYSDIPNYSVALVQEDGSSPVTPEYLNFGTGGKDGWKDIVVRVRNSSISEITAELDFTVSSDTLSGPSLKDEIFFSVDGGKNFQSLRKQYWVETPTIMLGGLSDRIVLRRHSPDTHDNARPYSVALTLYGYGRGESTGITYLLYVGDVDTREVSLQVWGSSPTQATPGSAVQVITAGAGSAQTDFSLQAYLISAAEVPISLPLSSWTNVAEDPALSTDVAYVDTIVHPTSVYEPAHQVLEFTVPSSAPAGHYSLVLYALGNTTQQWSTPVHLQVLSSAEAPSTMDGWRLQATYRDGSIIAANVPYKSLAFTDELSDNGSVKVELDFTSPFWTDTPSTPLSPSFIAENEFIWQVWEGKELRFASFNSIADDLVIDPRLTREQAIQSEGICSVLSWSTVAPPKFPEVPPYYWTFANARLWQWLTIWAECARRTPTGSVQRRVVPTFTRYTDTISNSWLDPGYENQQKNGINMLDLLKEHCDSVGADYHMRPDFKLDVMYSRSTIDEPGRYFGEDLKQVIFRAALVNMKRVLRDRSEVGNWVIAQDDYGEVTLQYDSASIAKNGMRERFVESGRSEQLTRRIAKAAEELKWHAEPMVSWSLSVDPYYTASDGTIFNRAFVDYKVGDWVYLDVEGSTELISVQVSAITISVDSSGKVEAEVTLESLAALRKRKAQLSESAKSGGSGSGGGSLVLFEEEIFPVASATPPTTYDIRYLPLPKSEIITIGMRKYMEVDGSGGLAVREFTRTLRRGVHWDRTGWTVTITDPNIFDESF